MLKSSKGITLVALVITIIVLLILAGVTISIAVNSGIMDKSQTAVNKYTDQEVNEAEKLNHLENQMDILFDRYSDAYKATT